MSMARNNLTIRSFYNSVYQSCLVLNVNYNKLIHAANSGSGSEFVFTGEFDVDSSTFT